MSKFFPTASEFAESAYDPILEKLFFGRVALANGTSKTTNAHRLDELNLTALPYIRGLSARPLRIMDVAVSSGISTQEWRDDLFTAGIETQMVGTDLTVEALHLPGRLADVLADKHLNVIHLSLLGHALPLRILRALQFAGLSPLARLAVAMGARPRPFRLVSKGVRDVTVLEDDIETNEEGPYGSFHVIRVANILNRAYFSSSQLRHMAFRLVRRLSHGGLFIVCRTNTDGSNHATIFRFEGLRLRSLTRLGDGSELEGILIECSESAFLVEQP